MSELNSIANGTYMIGETSDLNFEAGPGISITQPSGGTVRIASKETVLWEGENGELISANNYSVNLSDDPLSYNRIGVYGRASDNNTTAMYVEFDPSYSAICKTVTPYYNGTTQNCCYNSYSFSGTNKMTVVSQTHLYGTTSVAGGLWIYKVVGIDRKENA